MKSPLYIPSLMSIAVASALVLGGCTTQYNKPVAGTKAAADSEYDAWYGYPQPGANRTSGGAKQVVKRTNPFRSNAPTRYVVKKGDTLWGISRMFLKNPGYWPEIWDKNQKIRNPHRIFPGDVLYIHYGTSSAGGGGEVNVKLSPTIRVERNGKGMPIAMFEPFLSWPRIVSKNDLTSAPYIVAAKDAKILIENDKKVYVRGVPYSKVGDNYGVYHAIKEIHDPESGELIGTQIDYHGLLTVAQPGKLSAAEIEESEREIQRGDRVVRVNDKPPLQNVEIKAPSRKVRGTIMSLYDAEMISGHNMVAILNRGTRDGIRPGHELGIYSPPRLAEDPYNTRLTHWRSKENIKVKIPPERVGTMVVYDVSDRYSYALVTESRTAVKEGHKIGNP